ncbi:YodL domain-containing protein [Bacillus sp. SCS-153A]|uniref:YodL domain-containing protein n=1 Tax=Rossellomorea sedimentorum TaxID=3115294 RepID=UPI003906CD03
MALLEKIIRPKSYTKTYDITIFQTPAFGQRKGYKKVYRMAVPAQDRLDALEQTFRLFNVPDRMPKDYNGRYITTGDIIFVDEGRRGHYYFRLEPGGWKEVNRVIIR